MKRHMAPSLLAADFKHLGRQMKETEIGGATYLHFDVMDGMFVPSISFGMPVLASIVGCTKQIMDVHLMVQEPIRYIKDFADSGADIITVHVEACADVPATIEAIRACDVKVGLSICPETDVEELYPYIQKIDMALLMSVHPGFGGQKFIPEALEKIKKLRDYVGEEFDIQVDGGIYVENVKAVLDAGANVIVAGSAIFRGEAKENTEKFMEILNQYE